MTKRYLISQWLSSRCQGCAIPYCYDTPTSPAATKACYDKNHSDGVCDTQIASEYTELNIPLCYYIAFLFYKIDLL